jgi:hypothetical protein
MGYYIKIVTHVALHSVAITEYLTVGSDQSVDQWRGYTDQ